jgi:Arc/MetJ-type ribon-helix-helix transcriptional regulator
MQVQLTRPELERYITQQVEAGRFSSAQAAIEAAVEQMMLAGDEFELSDEDVEAINEAEDQIDRGETVDFDTFAAELRKRHSLAGERSRA